MIEKINVRLAVDGSLVVTTCDEAGCKDEYSLPEHDPEALDSGFTLRPLLGPFAL